MVLLVKRWLALVFICASFAFTQTAFAASDWEIIKVSGHDYLSVDNISKFYGLPVGVAGAGDKLRFETVKNPLEFVSGSREAMINGARSWLCFPVVEQDGKYLVSRTDVAKTIEPLVRPHRVSNVGRLETVVLDPGHGGYDKGQVSRLGTKKILRSTCSKAPPAFAGERAACHHDPRRRLFRAVGSACTDCE